MKKLLVLALIAVMAAGALAQELDECGLWVMEGGEYSNSATVMPYTPFTLYMTLHNTHLTTVSGFEMGIFNMPDVLVSATDLFGGTNFGQDFNYLVGYPGPRTAEDIFVLGSITCVSLAAVAGPINVELGAANPPSIPGHNGPVISDPDGNLTGCGYITGQPWVLTIAGDGPVPAQDESWSGVKNLFQ